MNLYAIRRRVLSNLKQDLHSSYKPGVVNKNKQILEKIEPVVAVAPKV